MERFAAEGIKAERDQAVRSALRAKVPWTDIARDFGLSEAEISKLISEELGGTVERKGSAIITKVDATPSGRR